MNINYLRFYFVGVLDAPFTRFEITDKTFSRNLFKDPINTNDTLDVTGKNYTISRDVDNVQLQMLLLNEQRIQLSSVVIDDLRDLVPQVLTKLGEINDVKKPIGITRYGFTLELEVLDFLPEDQPVFSWFNDTFFKNSLDFNSIPVKNIFSNEISFTIVSDPQIYHVTLQPRSGNDRGLFIKIVEDAGPNPEDYSIALNKFKGLVTSKYTAPILQLIKIQNHG